MSEQVYILGAGMHPWGKWGRDFTEYGVVAARAALRDAALDWRQIQLVAGADTIRNGYPGFVAGATFAQKLGWTGIPVSSSYAACASGSQALQSARAQIMAGLCDVALVVGADTTPKGFFAPVGGDRRDDPDWLRFRLIGATNPVYFALLARRRMDLYGATLEDFAAVKVKNSRHGLHNPNARYPKEFGGRRLASPVVSDPLRLLEICATSDGAAALVVASKEYARSTTASTTRLPSVRAVSCATPNYPQHLPELPDIATDSTAVVPAPERVFKDHIPMSPMPRPASVRRISALPRCTTCPPRWNWTGTSIWACARAVRPNSCCAPGRRRSAGASPSTPPVGWPASAKPFRPRPSPRSAS